MTPASAELRLLEEIPHDRESPLFLTLAVAVARGSKLDWVVEKATELGVSRILPFTSQRTVPRREEFTGRVERWRRIADSAAAQCGRARCPAIVDVSKYSEVLSAGAGHDFSLLFREGCHEPIERSRFAPPRRLLIVTGPEGGFAPGEAAEAERQGFFHADLGPRILRAETAAIVAVALCQLLWGDLALR